jgi:hypothetical protein
MFGLGSAMVNISYEYTVLNKSGKNIDVEGNRLIDVRGFFVFQKIVQQPSKNWVEIDSFEYREGPVKHVELIHKGIRTWHNVRVRDSDSSDILFQGSCSFDGESGVLDEGFITKGTVDSGNAYWEVELKEGE